MGGGDDLGSDDDEYLSSRVAVGQDDDDTSAEGSSDDDESKAVQEDAGAGIRSNENETTARKRKMKTMNDDDDDDDIPDKKKKKRNRNSKKDPSMVLLEAARQLERQTAKQQATFLDTALRHFKLMSLSSSSSPPPLKEEDIPKGLIQPQHLFRSPNSNGTESQGAPSADIVDRLKEAVSLKKLKKWKHRNSPCVIFVCISARRAVAVLKDLSRLKMRMAKLFPKNGSVEEQRQQLASNAFGVAVGTPHRLNVLLGGSKEEVQRRGGGRTDTEGTMSLDRTQLIVLDSHSSNKQYTVCTLPDTAPQCMALLYDHVVPQLQRRKGLRLAFF